LLLDAAKVRTLGALMPTRPRAEPIDVLAFPPDAAALETMKRAALADCDWTDRHGRIALFVGVSLFITWVADVAAVFRHPAGPMPVAFGVGSLLLAGLIVAAHGVGRALVERAFRRRARVARLHAAVRLDQSADILAAAADHAIVAQYLRMVGRQGRALRCLERDALLRHAAEAGPTRIARARLPGENHTRAQACCLQTVRLLQGAHMTILDKVIEAVTPEESEADRMKARADAQAVAADGDWLSLVLQHHEQIEAGFAAVRAATGAESRRFAQQELATVINGHALAEEVVLYPALAMNEEKAHATMGFTEQSATKVQMAELDELDPESDEYMDKLEQIRTALAHHIYKEEGTWYIELQQKLDPLMSEKLTARYQEEFSRYVDAEANVMGLTEDAVG
jgi:hypothetical protein